MNDSNQVMSSARPTRAEVEMLCVLHVVVSEGSSVTEIAERLGLSAAHREALSEAIEPMIECGLLARCDAGVRPTFAGQNWLANRCVEFGA